MDVGAQAIRKLIHVACDKDENCGLLGIAGQVQNLPSHTIEFQLFQFT